MRVRSFRFACAVVALFSVASMSTAGHAAGSELDCTKNPDERISSMPDAGTLPTSALGLEAGRYALPENASAATQLVVMFHGHQNDSCSWRLHLRQAADRGAIAVAMDYSGTKQSPVIDYGWPTRSGAADSIAAAQYFLAHYSNLKTVVAFGISMGGNISGYAVAAGAKKADGSALFDYWIDVEGVNNILEEYAYVRALGPAVAAADVARQELEEENGGPIESKPDAYLETDNVLRAPDMASLKGGVIVNGIDDSQVPTEQSPEMGAALNLAGVPTHVFTVLGSDGAEDGSTYTEVVGQPVYDAAGLGAYKSPLAGHGWEGSDTQLVIKTGFDQLWSLLGGVAIEAGETVVPGV